MLKIGHEVVRPGKTREDSPVTIPVPEELETVPGIPLNMREVDWYAREYPLETMNITERASRDWANSVRDSHVEMREIRKEHDKLNRPLIMAARLTGDQSSNLLTSMACANGLAICPEDLPKKETGETVQVQMLDWSQFGVESVRKREFAVWRVRARLSVPIQSRRMLKVLGDSACEGASPAGTAPPKGGG